MITDADQHVFEGQDLDDEEKILRKIEEFKDGISTFALTSESHLKSSLVAPIIDRLESDGKIHGEKHGLVYYWKIGPDPLKGEPSNHIASRLRSVDKVIALDPKEDRAAPDHFPREKLSKGSMVCQFCGKRAKKNLKQHERLCHQNPNRYVRPVNVMKKPADELAEASATKDHPVECGKCPDVATCAGPCLEWLEKNQREQSDELAEAPVDHTPEPEALPHACPSCGTALVEELEGKLYCPNKNCELGPGEGSEPPCEGEEGYTTGDKFVSKHLKSKDLIRVAKASIPPTKEDLERLERVIAKFNLNKSELQVRGMPYKDYVALAKESGCEGDGCTIGKSSSPDVPDNEPPRPGPCPGDCKSCWQYGICLAWKEWRGRNPNVPVAHVVEAKTAINGNDGNRRQSGGQLGQDLSKMFLPESERRTLMNAIIKGIDEASKKIMGDAKAFPGKPEEDWVDRENRHEQEKFFANIGKEVRPDHYRGLVQPLEYERIGMTREEIRGFLRGNAMKYLMRYPRKGGVEDLRKADTYVGWLIEHEEKAETEEVGN